MKLRTRITGPAAAPVALATAALALTAFWACTGEGTRIEIAAGETDPEPGGLYEVRTYHFDPARFEEYAEVARGEYIRYLREHLDIAGFWIDAGLPAEVRGAEQDELGPGNVTWVIRWASRAERDEKLPQVLGTPEWQEIFAEVPGGGASYRRIEIRFMESLD